MIGISYITKSHPQYIAVPPPRRRHKLALRPPRYAILETERVETRVPEDQFDMQNEKESEGV